MKKIKFKTLAPFFILLIIATVASVFVSRNMVYQKTYSNSEFGFSFSYPVGVIMNRSTEFSCNTFEDSKTFNVKAGTLVPVKVTGDKPFDNDGRALEEGGTRDQVFNGYFAYEYNNCTFGSLVYFTVNKPGKDFNLSAYLDKKVEEDIKHQLGSAAGYSVKKISINVNGNEIPVIRTQATTAVRSTEDLYFFQKGEYVYVLSNNYSQTLNDLPPNERNADVWALNAWRDYQLSQEIIKGFEMTNVLSTDSDLNLKLGTAQEKIYLGNTTIELLPATEQEYMEATESNNFTDRLDYSWEMECGGNNDWRKCIEDKAFNNTNINIVRRVKDCVFVTTQVGEKKFCDPEGLDYATESDGVVHPYSFYGILPNGLVMVHEQLYESSRVHLVNPNDGSITILYASPIPYTFKSSTIMISYYLNQADGPNGLIQIYDYIDNKLFELYKFTPNNYTLSQPRVLNNKTFIWKVDNDFYVDSGERYVRMNISD